MDPYSRCVLTKFKILLTQGMEPTHILTRVIRGEDIQESGTIWFLPQAQMQGVP